jgi:hypothetical protein
MGSSAGSVALAAGVFALAAGVLALAAGVLALADGGALSPGGVAELISIVTSVRSGGRDPAFGDCGGGSLAGSHADATTPAPASTNAIAEAEKKDPSRALMSQRYPFE